MNALTKYLCGLMLCGLLIFLPAGTLRYFGGWLFMGAVFIPILLMGIVLFIKAPALLEKRLSAKEKQQSQKGVIAGSAALFLAIFLLAGLDFRFGWSVMPRWVSIAAAGVFLAGYGMYAEVLRENVWLSRVVEVQQEQKVISSGLYGVVRHPMYLATLLLFGAVPLMLGSWYMLIPFAAYPLLIAARIRGEEALLAEQLEGYTDYQKKVKYRLIPFIW
jgi:protein-S-isoprenylcysteine O-methyltransferase Ste14